MDFEVYCDESRYELFRTRDPAEGNYVLIGGIWIEAARRQWYKARIHELRERHRVFGEFKWNRVTPSRAEFYLDLIRLFFREEMRFRCIVLAREEMDAVRFHQADSD